MFGRIYSILRPYPVSVKPRNLIFQLITNRTMYVTKQDNIRCLKITKGRSSTNYHYLWLREHCRCDACYNNLTCQRKITVADIPFDIRPKSVHIDNATLRVIWEGGHKSEFDVTWLESCSFENCIKRMERNYIIWTKEEVINAPLARVDFEAWLTSPKALYYVMASLVDYGVAFLENVPADVESTRLAVQKIAHVQNTLFGGVWVFDDSLERLDSAYTSAALDPHTDNTYFTEAAGLQILHCIEHNGSGGETILVDGFKAIDILREKHPDVFLRLTNTLVGAEYIEDGYHHINYAPIINVNSFTKQVDQIRYNLSDRSPVVLPQDQILRHYEDLQIFSGILKNPTLEWRFKLNPGTVVIFDNFRILHGRTSYTGKRVLCGCYISRTDFLSLARVLNLLED